MGEYERKQGSRLSRTIANSSTESYCKNQKISIIDRRGCMMQLKPAHEDIPNYNECFDDMTPKGTAPLLEIQGDGNIYKKKLTGNVDTRVQALSDISTHAAMVGNKTPKSNYGNTADKIAPFLYDITKCHREEKGDDEQRELTIRYQMSKERAGYILQINDGIHEGHIRSSGENRLSPSVFNVNHADTQNEVISSLLTDTKRYEVGNISREHGNKSWDAYTKLAGEGARFRCVRNHIENIKDNTTFGINDNGYNGRLKPNVTFSTLWKSWGMVFDSAFDIPDSTVAEKIKLKNKFIKGGDIKSSEGAEARPTDFVVS